MKKIKIAFDVDGTLRDNKNDDISDDIIANERIRNLLIILSSFKNTIIYVWSGNGKEYAQNAAKELCIEKYVDKYESKNFIGKDGNVSLFKPNFKPDIAIDDIQACNLGAINLIVREK